MALTFRRSRTGGLWSRLAANRKSVPGTLRSKLALGPRPDPAAGRGRRPGLWAALAAGLDPARQRPKQAQGIQERRLQDRRGPYFVLKNPRRRTYLRLSPQEHFLWSLMDGSQTLHEIVAAHFLEHGTFAYGLARRLVALLRAKGMLEPEPQRLLTRLEQALEKRRPTHWVSAAISGVLRQQLALEGLDGWVTALYRRGGRLLFTRPAQAVWLTLAVAGLVLFWPIFRDAGYALLGEDARLGMVGLWLVILGPVLIHELGHALTTKHYRRQVNRGGLLLFFGMPAAFVDTTDIWMEDKRARLAVTWAGPYTGLVLGGLAALVIRAAPDGPLAGPLFKMALLAYLTVLLNLNPLLKLDGYYLLSDWLEIPLLRERSLAFVRHKLWGKLRRLERLRREELIFSTFGLLALVWTGYALYLSAFFWNRRVSRGVEAILSTGSGLLYRLFSLFIVLVAAAFFLMLAIRLVAVGRRLVARLRRVRLVRVGRVSLSLGMAALVPAVVVDRLGWSWLGAALGSAALVAGGWALARGAVEHRPALRSWLLGVGAVAALVAAGGRFAGGAAWLLGWPALLAALPLLGLSRDGRGGLRWLPLGVAGAGLLLAGAGGALGEQALGLWGAFALAGGAWLQLAAGRSWRPAGEAPGALRGSGSVGVLRYVLRHMVRWVLAGVRVTAGLAGRGRVERAFNARSGVMGWGLRVGEGVVVSDPSDLALLDLAEDYRDALNELVELAAREVGLEPARRALVLGYDALWWEEREVAEEYLLSRLDRAGELRQRFRRQRDERLALLERMPLLAGMSRDELRELSARLRPERHAKGEAIIRQGEPGRTFYMVSRGRVEVWQADASGYKEMVNQHTRGGYFGELALLHDAPRNATCRAATAVEVLALDRVDFDALVRRRLEVRPKLEQTLTRAQLLGRLPLFRELDAAGLQKLAGRLVAVTLEPGAYLFRQGDPGERFYLVEEGEVEILLDGGRLVDRRGPAEYLGEVALLLDVPRTASVRAATACRLLALDRQGFQELIQEELVGRTLELAGTRRLRDIERLPAPDEALGDKDRR